MYPNYLRTISATTKDGKVRLSVNSKTVYEVHRDALISDPGQMLADIAASIAEVLRARSYRPRRPKPVDKSPAGAEGVLRTREGLDIVGTLEVLTGTAGVTGGVRNPDGSITPSYEGGTKVNWDEQKPFRCVGAVLFVDENGNTHSADDVVIEAS